MQAEHRWRFLLLVGALVALGMTGAIRAQEDKPLDRKEIDQRIYAVLRDVINTGADIYNPPSGDRAGCYRLYHGALLTVRPLLDHRPKLQEAIDAGLADAQRETSPGAKAFALRRVIDKVRAEIKPEGEKAAGGLWDRLGGEKGVAKVVDDFVDLAVLNPKVDFTRGGKFKPNKEEMAELKNRLVEMISEATGGPLKYKGKSMKEVHKDMKISNAEFDATAGDLKKALEKNDVKADDVTALMKIVETTRKDVVAPDKPEPKPEPKDGQVKGRVTLKGKPLVAGSVTFVPDDDLTKKGTSADLEADGSFQLKGGLKPGKYRIVVTEGDKKAGVPAKFSDAKTSEVVFEVKQGDNELKLEIP